MAKEIVEITDLSGRLLFVISAELMNPFILECIKETYETPLRVEGKASYESHNLAKSDAISEPATSKVLEVATSKSTEHETQVSDLL